MNSSDTASSNPYAFVLRLVSRRESILALFIALLILLVGIRAPAYLALKNIDNLFINTSFLIILVLGQLPVLLTRGIDLSQAAVLAFCGMFLAQLSLTQPELPASAFIVLSLMMGACLGAVNGVFIAWLRIPPIIMTLGTMTIFRGLVYMLSEGAWVSSHEMSDAFKAFPSARMWGLPHIVWVSIACVLAVSLLLTYTRTGRNLYALGGNPTAARFAGISRIKMEVLVYVLSGAAAGLCGYLWTARFAIAYTQAAEGREFAIIAACVIGGVSIAGGKGSVIGALLGALMIAVVETALPFLRVNAFLQQAILGAVILIAIVANARTERKIGRRILRLERSDGDLALNGGRHE